VVDRSCLAANKALALAEHHAVFLPVVGNYGYSAMFFFWAACTVIYFVTAAFFLPETKGKTLEEIEAYFERGEAKPSPDLQQRST
jgi:hypothetical protein